MRNTSKKQYYIGVSMRPRTIYHAKPVDTPETRTIDFHCSNMIIQGDVHIQLFEKSSKNRIFGFWINTLFIPSNGSVSFSQRDLDALSRKNSLNNLQAILYTEKIQFPNDSEKINKKSSESHLPRCSKCDRHVVGSSVSIVYLRSVFHWECLKCSRCDESLIDKEECVVEDHIDKLLCAKCSDFIDKCSECGSSIRIETCQEIDGIGLICVNCYRCCTCKALLGWDNNGVHNHVVKENKLYCLLHAKQQTQSKAQGDGRGRPLPPNPRLPHFKSGNSISKTPSPINYRTFSAPPNPVLNLHQKSKSTTSLRMRNVAKSRVDKSFPFILCSKCKKPIDLTQAHVTMESDNFHSKCFTCSICFKLLSTGNVYHVEGDKIYCDLDFQRLQPNCEICGDLCQKDFIRIRGTDRHIHSCCFNCKSCGGPLFGLPFFTGTSGLYCKNCWPSFRERELPKMMSEL